MVMKSIPATLFIIVRPSGSRGYGEGILKWIAGHNPVAQAVKIYFQKLNLDDMMI